MKPKLILCLALASNVALPAMAQAQFRYTTNSGSITGEITEWFQLWRQLI